MKILFPNRKRTSVRPRKRPASTERRNRGIRSPRPAETGTDGAGNRAGALFGRLLFDRQFAAIEAALGAYAVIERRRAAIRTGYDRRNDCLVMGSSLIPSGRRDFVFRMCHVLLLFYLFGPRGSSVSLLFMPPREKIKAPRIRPFPSAASTVPRQPAAPRRAPRSHGRRLVR